MFSGAKSLFLFIVLFSVAYNATLPLHPDEAYYWVWSRSLELSYYDHPPLVAYAIRLISLFGESEVMIRMAAIAAMSGTAWLIYKTSQLLFNKDAAELSLAIYLLVPMTHVGLLVVTPDPFLSLFWALTLYLVCYSVFKQRPEWLPLAGISAGCALLSKYTGILLPVSLLLFFITIPKFRSVFFSRQMLVTIFFSVAVFLPVIYWNFSHDWISFRYQFEHGVAEEKMLQLSTFAEFFIGQTAVSNPFFFIPILFFIVKSPLRTFQEPRLAVLVWPFVFTLLFLGYNSLFKKSELNWAMPAMISGSVLLGYWLQQAAKRWILCGASIFLLLVLVLFKVPELVPALPGDLVMKNKFSGYDKLFSAIQKDDQEFVLSDNYEDASSIAYYLPGRPIVHILDAVPVSQYSFWRDRLTGHVGKDAIWIGQGEPSPAVKAAFAQVIFAETRVYSNRFITKKYNIYRCKDYNGLLP